MIEKHLETYDPAEIERGVKGYWNKRDISRIVLTDKRVGGSKHYIVHTPHLLEDTFNLMDIYPKLLYDIWYRFQYMNGHNIRSPYGYDTYSLSVEQKAFSSMELEFFEEIEDKDIDRFIRMCQRIALEDKEIVEEEYKNMAFFYDPKKFYSSYPSTFIDSCWWAVKNLYEGGFIEKREELLPWCDNCQTSLTKFEQTRVNKVRNEYLLKFSTKKGTDRNFLVHYKDPWKLLGTVALVVYPKREYCVLTYQQNGQDIKSVMLKDNIKAVMDLAEIKDYEIINTFLGKSLEGLDFVHPLDEISPQLEGNRYTHKIIASHSVPASKTGIYPLTPGLDSDSTDLAKEYGFPEQSLLTEVGTIADIKHLAEYAGLKVDEMNQEIIEQMESEDTLFSYIEEVSFVECCTYCKSPYDHEEDEQWFLKANQLRGKSKQLFDKIEKQPKWMGTTQEDNWFLGSDNLFITRRDGWGMPFPLWHCECGEVFLPETMEDLISATSKKRRESNIMSVLRELRNLSITCPACDNRMEWEGKMLNSLALAAMSPWAQAGYPQKHVEGWWPGDIMFGSVNDKDGIFNMHLALAGQLFDTPPVETWVGHGEVVLMYKELDEFIKRTGKDPFRMGLIADQPMYDDMKITSETFKRSTRFLKVFWNIHSFYLSESSKRDFSPDETHLEFLKEYMRVEDRWLISRLENLNKEAKAAYQNKRFDIVVAHVERFILEDIAQWYIELSRTRLDEGMQRDILSVLKVLHESLLTVSKIIAPIVPYISEQVYLDLEAKEPSVFLCRWPVTNRLFIDEFIEDEMNEVRTIVDGILEGKRKEQIPEKWPLKRIVVDANDGVITALIEKYGDIIKAKARIEKIEVVPPDEEWEEMILEVHPNYNAIGKAYRQWVSRIALMLEKRPAKEIKVGIDKGEYKLGIEGGIVEIQKNMVTFERELPIGFSEVNTNHGGIYLDREIDPNIWFKQIAREIMLRIKCMRLDLDMDSNDQVEVYIDASDDVVRAVDKHSDWIKTQVRARNIHFGEDDIIEAEYLVEWNIAGQIVDLLQVYGYTSQRHQWEVTGQSLDIGITPLYRSKMIELYQSIPGMSRELGERLYEAGYTTLRALKKATPAEISSVDGFKRSLGRRIVQVVKQRGDEFEARIEGRLTEAEEFEEEERRKKRLLKTLQRVDGIGPARAESIYDMGYKDFTDFLDADIDQLTNISHIKPSHAIEIVDVIREEYDLEEDDEISEGKISEETTELINCEQCGAELTPDAEVCYACAAEVVFNPEEEEVESEEEPLPEGLVRGMTYLITESSEDKPITLLQDLLEAGLDGLLITRQYPRKVSMRYGLEDIEMVWLSNVDRGNSIRPKNLEKFSLLVERFLNEERGVILLNGIDYLISNNDFRTILHLIQSLKDQVAITESILLIPVNTKTLEENQIDQLKSEIEEIIK